MAQSTTTITQQDVAKHMGVSRAWVARALSGDPRISARSRARVEEAARQAGYLPEANRIARSLAGRRYGHAIRCNVIGCLNLHLTASGDPEEPALFSLGLLVGVDLAARNHGQEILLTNASAELRHGRVDGVLAFGAEARSMRKAWYPDLPFVTVNEPLTDAHFVVGDDYGGTQQAVAHLLQLGHRRIAYLGHAHAESHAIDRRLQGYQDALQSAGIAAKPAWTVRFKKDNPSYRESGRCAMRQWLERDWRKTGCTALLAQNDHIAMGAIRALIECGLRVPEDVSVIGFDSTRECDIFNPRLTSVHLPLATIGAAAIDLLMREVRGEVQTVQHIVVPTKLDVRDTTAASGL